MMLSEKEAGHKWCPQMLAVYFVADTPHDYLDKATSCQGSACMAWRWEDNRHERGFCGIGGKPELT
jgi:hypothetical protein